MSATQDLSLLSAEDVVVVYRLIERLCNLGDDVEAWREFFVVELCRIFQAQLGISYLIEFSLDPTDTAPKTLIYIETGGNEIWKSFLAKGDWTANPASPHLMERLGTDFTCTHREWFDEEFWHNSDFFKTVAGPSNYDDGLYSQVGIIRPGVVDGIGMSRAVGEPLFSPKDVAMCRLIHQELARLWRKHDPLDAHMIPPRQREVLEGIRRGDGRKAIADKMGVSEHTVHSYEKALFDRAKVNSRGELQATLAKLVRPTLLP